MSELSEKIKDYIVKEYGSVAKYSKVYGIPLKAMHNMLEPRRNLNNIGGQKWLEYFGPLGIDMETFYKDGEIKPVVEEIKEGKKNAAPCYKSGKSLEDYSVIEEADSDFYVEITDNEMSPRFNTGDRIACRYASEITPGSVGVFLINGNIALRFYSEPDGFPALSAVGKVPEKIEMFDGIKLIGTPC